MMLAQMGEIRPQHRVQLYEVTVELKGQPGLKRESREEETSRVELICCMLLFLLGHILINDAETKTRSINK